MEKFQVQFPDHFIKKEEIQILDKIGKGGYSIVYKGKYLENDVAIKSIEINDFKQKENTIQEISLLM
jgi:predicted Ser/Thr protein kinase